MWNWIKSLFMPRIETPQMIIARELHEAQIDKLQAEKEAEYWSSQVQMFTRRIYRLRVECNQAPEL